MHHALLRGIVYPLLGILLGVLWLLGTESGSQAIVYGVGVMVPGTLCVQSVKGDLLSQVTLTGIDYSQGKTRFRIQTLTLSTAFWGLLQQKLEIPELSIRSAEYTAPYMDKLKVDSLSLSAAWSWYSHDLRLNLLGPTEWRWAKHRITLLPMEQTPAAAPQWKLYWRFPNAQDAPEQTVLLTLLQSSTPDGIQLSVPDVPIAPILSNFSDRLKWEAVGDLSIKLTPAASGHPMVLGAQLSLPPGHLLVRDTPYSWLKLQYQAVQARASVSSQTWQVQASLEEGQFFLPAQGIAIEHLSLTTEANAQQPFKTEGKAQLGEAWAEFHSDALDTWHLKGQDLLISNTHALWALGSPSLTLHYQAPHLLVSGHIDIPRARVRLKAQVNQSVHSKDIVFVDQQTNTESAPSSFKLMPQFSVTLKRVALNGYGLDAQLEGKLSVSRREDDLLAGQGLLWIQQGKYRLQGKTRHIDKGRLFFPSGTLLSDPLLDIRITDRHMGQRDEKNEVGVSIQGTLTRPQMQLYSKRVEKQATGLSFAQPQNDSQTALASQSALLLADGVNPLIDGLQNQLGLEEVNVESRQAKRSTKTPSDTDTVLVVGKYLSPRVYLQYLKSMLEDNSTVKLKYFLGSHWALGVETGTAGSGSDVSFSIDTD